MKNILILNAGTRNTLVQDFINTIDGECDVIVTDSFELAPSLYEVPKHYVTKRWDEEGYWDEILSLCDKENIGLVFSLIDPELEILAEKKCLFEKKGILVNIGDKAIVETAFDKYATLNFIKEHGYNWIKTYIDLNEVLCALNEKEISFPLMTKPRKGSGSNRVEIVDNVTRLAQIFQGYEDVLVQEFINGKEIGVDVYVDLLSKEVVSIFAKQKLKMRAGETDKSVSIKRDSLFDLVRSFVTEFGLVGVNDIDIFERNGEYYISEVNPRFGGGYLHAYAAGVDFPRYLLNNMKGISNLPEIGKYIENQYMMKYFAIKTIRKDFNE